jgi:uncharacterized Zn-binding protein involved in type VI secretion
LITRQEQKSKSNTKAKIREGENTIENDRNGVIGTSMVEGASTFYIQGSSVANYVFLRSSV